MKSLFSRLGPGLLVAVTVAMAASFLSVHYGAPVMLFALLLGMAFNFLSEEGRCVPGLQTASTQILQVGVALLGARITIEQVAELGLVPVATVFAAILLTIGFGILAARLLGLPKQLGILTGGSVGICGASAAMAMSTTLPKYQGSERDTIFTVVAVTTLSTVAMIAYPIIAVSLGLSHAQAGFFLGATIHDVAQVVGAGYSVSGQTGDVATIVKLARVAMLVPVILILWLGFGIEAWSPRPVNYPSRLFSSPFPYLSP